MSKGHETLQPQGLREVNHYSWSEIGARFWPFVRPYLAKCVIAFLLVSAVGLVVAAVPLFPKYVIDTAIPQKSLRLALGAAGIFLVVQFVRMGMWFGAMIIVYRVQQSIVFELRAQSFAHLQRLCLRFHSQFSSGFIYERVFGNSINMLGNFMQVLFQHLATYFAGLLFSLAFCLYLSPALTLVILCGTIGYVVAARVLSRRIYHKTRESTEAGMSIVNLIMDKLRGHKTIQSFAMEERVQEEFQRQLWPAMMKWMEAVLESMKLGFVTEGLGYVITAVVIVGGAYLVMGGSHPLGTLVAFMGYQGTLVSMIQTLTNFYGQFMSARAAFDQLFTVLDTHSTIVEKPGVVMPARIEGRLEFRDVSFAYEEHTPVLCDVSVALPPARTIALGGRSGSGKTTMANLLLRFYDPSAGAILLDGRDIRELPLRGYRALFSVVLQDPFLFDTTIGANLRYVRPDATEGELIEALEQACAWEFVSRFPDRLNHRVGEAGGQLSGGQRQRLAIARCLLARSRFVILDEATAALDPESEMMVRHSFDALCRDRSVVVIAHRLSTIRNADSIVVLDQGHVVEQGRFDELLTRGGMFARLHAIATSTSTQKLKLEEAGFE